MSLSVNRDSISKFMSEFVDTFPVESVDRASISDFGKLLFTEGQAGSRGTAKQVPEPVKEELSANPTTVSDQDESEGGSAHKHSDAKGNKRVYTEIKGVPRQKQHDMVVTESGKITLSQGSVRKIMKSKDKAMPKRWSQEEDERLRDAVQRHGEKNWKSIAEEVPGRNHTQCLQRWTKVLAPGLVKGHWRPDEDELLKKLVAEGRKNWGQVATRIPGRTSKQCRERWYNHLDPSIVRGEYTAEEDRMIIEAQARLGNRWSAIAAMLPGRTEDAVKIRWKSLCRVRKTQGRRPNAEKNKNVVPAGSSPAVVGQMPASMMPMTGQHDASHGYQHPTAGVVGTPGRLQVPQPPPSSLNLLHQSAAMQQTPTHAMSMAGMNGMGGNMGGMYQPGYSPYGHAMHASTPQAQHPGMVTSMAPQGYGGGYGQGMAPAELKDEYSIDRRNNMVNLSASNGMYQPQHPYSGMSPAHRGGYDPMTPTTTPMHGAPPAAPVYRPMGTAPMIYPSYHDPSQMLHHSQQQVYGAPQQPSNMRPSIPSPSGYAPAPYGQPSMDSNNVAARFMQQQQQQPHSPMPQQQPQQTNNQSPLQQQQQPEPQQQQQQQPKEQQPHSGHSTPTHRQSTSPGAVNPVAAFMNQQKRQQEQNKPPAATSPSQPQDQAQNQQQEQQSSTTTVASQPQQRPPLHDKPQSSASSKASTSVSVNPVASFLQQQNQKPSSANKSSDGKKKQPPTMANNPVMAFIQQQKLQRQQQQQQQQQQQNSQQPNSKPPIDPASKPHSNLAASFVTQMQQQRNGNTNSNNTTGPSSSTATEEMDGPSLKRVKPRNSIDTARAASAARRSMRNSEAGRASLETFLNEIGDIGRISDLKMEEFQEFQELWRVSDDMNRLSL